MIALAQNAVETAQSGSSASLRLLDLPAAWIVVLVVLPILALITWLGYGRENISNGARAVLSGLRFVSLVLLFLVLCRPVLVERREEVYPAEVLILVDDSASMRRRDSYSGDQDTRSRLEDVTGGSVADTTRLELVQRALGKTLLADLPARDYEVKLFGFSESALAWTSPADATGRGPGTHIGDALTQVLAGHRGSYVTDVVVLSDGRQNGGLSMIEAARSTAAGGVPVHTVVVGDTRPERNALLELVEAPDSALEGDEIAIAVRIVGRGTEDVSTAQVVLEELDPRDELPPRLLEEDDVALSPAGERVVLVAPPEGMPGERRFRVSIPPLPGETMTDDNMIEFSVHVSAATMRVLYVDGYPRWEYRYLKNLLLRADEKIEAQCFLLSATPDFPQESSRGLPALTRVPTTRQELLDRYDVVILGDVNPYAVSPDPAEVDAFLAALREFVEAGGGLLFQSGEYDNPRAFIQTPLEDVLPVVLDATGVLAFEGDTRREFRPSLEDAANPHEIVRLHADLEINRTLWEDARYGLRGFYWFSPIERAKPASEVLLRHPEARNNNGNYPLLVIGYFPAGRTMFLGVDSTWMWRFHYGDRYHERFWRNAIRWLALGRLKSGDRRYRLETTRSTYHLDERVVLEARVLDEDFRPSDRPAQEAFWSNPDGRTTPVQLGAVPDRPGVYRAALQVERPGLYRAWIEAGPDRARVSTTEFEVVLPSRENDDPSPDPDAMRTLAVRTGGRALTLAGLSELSAEFPGDEERREPISSRLDDAWDHWGTLMLALALLSAEWILRKRVELV